MPQSINLDAIIPREDFEVVRSELIQPSELAQN
jgi:hypothetical protein